ncbi:fasciclin domain-containing protein [Aquidulcibacter sp.]|uniref:fasciclin domain-containing protein n=1 Tax=Aquidulcibacter sp. TaxID=2052990 RepID=UPI0025C11C85|nr:fasciclin domain-containing protein [Aquidulcibacter sp.]
MLNFKMFASAAAALALSAAPAMAQCAKTHTDAAAQAAGYQTIGYHAASNAAKPAKGDIIDVAVGAGSFNTLAAALSAAGLVDTLKTSGPFTVFAPTDAAFAKLPAGTVETLLKPENRAQLISILTYHVVPGKITSNQLLDKVTPATTVQGRKATIDGRNGRVTVNGVAVIAADVGASNGVIHVIDTVLMPPAPKHH